MSSDAMAWLVIFLSILLFVNHSHEEKDLYDIILDRLMLEQKQNKEGE